MKVAGLAGNFEWDFFLWFSNTVRMTVPDWHDLIWFDFRRYAGIPDFLTADDMEAMVSDNRLDPKMIFSYVQEVYRMCNEM